MRISFCCSNTKPEPWLEGFRQALPGVEIEVWQPGGAPSSGRRPSASSTSSLI
jgi:hypothetical protein